MPTLHASPALPSPHALPQGLPAVAYDPAPALPRAGLLDTLGVFIDVLLPNVAKGVIIRRPAMTALAERLELERRAVRRLQALRARHGTAPLMLRLPLRRQAVILDPAHVHRVLQQTPQPFSSASSEKRAALAHMQPRGSLVSEGADRTARRHFNEQVLDHASPVHQLSGRFLQVVQEEARQLLRLADSQGSLGWPAFAEVWARLVRRICFGEGARDDHELSMLMTELRRDANWAFMKPQRKGLRERLHERLGVHLGRAEPGSLAEMVGALQPTRRMAPEQQAPQWLFAFDPAGMTTVRTLALLAAHPGACEMARQEAREHDAARLPFVRACITEALRLWPTTPMLLRQTTEDTEWDGAVMPAGTGVLIYAPFFHRDDELHAWAHRFMPELWLRERSTRDWPLIPFSEGPGVCPGRHLVQLVTSSMVAALIAERQVELSPATRLEARLPMPGTLSPYNLRFIFRP